MTEGKRGGLSGPRDPRKVYLLYAIEDGKLVNPALTFDRDAVLDAARKGEDYALITIPVVRSKAAA